MKDGSMIVNRCACAGFAAALVASACASAPLVRQECYNPDAQLAGVLQPLEALRAKGCNSGLFQNRPSECDRLRNEVERLALVCPGHVPTLMANAVMAYDEHQPEKSQQFLDQILAQSRAYPDAVVLRARIAVEEGNVPFARRLLLQQITLSPDHAGLHETLGATLFLDRQLEEARRELTTAGTLGAPRWRIAYHLGLVAEMSGQFDDARRFYAESLEAHPGWAPAQARLNGLRAKEPPAR
jgi:tetratricopeptide (TPR) repeat protein